MTHFGRNKDILSNFRAVSSNHAAIEAVPESLTIRLSGNTGVLSEFCVVAVQTVVRETSGMGGKKSSSG